MMSSPTPSRLVAALLTGLLLLSACDSGSTSPGGTVPSEDVPAVALRVRDAATGERLEREVTGWIEDGEFLAPLELRTPPEPDSGEVVLAGGFDRTGEYTIHLESPFFETWTEYATVGPAPGGWPETVTLDAGLTFRGLSGTWAEDSTTAGVRPDTLLIRHDHDGAAVTWSVFLAPEVVRLDTERVVLRFRRMEGNAIWRADFDLLFIPPDTLSGTLTVQSVPSHFLAVRTGPPPPP